MTQIPLLRGAYQYRGVLASAQRCVNLYPESNVDPQAPAPVTHWPTPGTTVFGQVETADNAKVRCTYRTSVGTAYTVIGPKVFSVSQNGGMSHIGTIPDRTSQISMADNGLTVVLVDGVSGWAIDMSTNNFGVIVDPSFYGADFVVFLDTFFVFNRPGTNQFYISLGMVTYALLTAGTAFDPLDIAAKAGNADPIVAIITVHRELWLIGELTAEVWIGTGSADFYFQQVQGAFIDHGCIAQYSPAAQDVSLFWLMQDKQGKNIVVKGTGYDVSEISTPAIVAEFNSYSDTSDAIGFCLQYADHAFYVLTFPTANKTWVYDLKIGQWHEWNWMNENGILQRHRANCCMFAFGKNIGGDWEYGLLLEIDPETFTDVDPSGELATTPIPRIRTFPHIVSDGKLLTYTFFVADMNVGTTEPDVTPQVSLRWSDNRGASYGDAVIQPAGAGGDYIAQVSWPRLGMARDRVFELSWSSAFKTALNGAFIEFNKSKFS